MDEVLCAKEALYSLLMMKLGTQGTPSNSYGAYKWCFVPECNNSSSNTPQKLFLAVPRVRGVRRQWAKMARRDDAGTLTSLNPWYCCEDHFDVSYQHKHYQPDWYNKQPNLKQGRHLKQPVFNYNICSNFTRRTSISCLNHSHEPCEWVDAYLWVLWVGSERKLHS